MGEYVRRSRAFAVTMAKRLVPSSRAATWALTTGVKLFTALPHRPGATARRGGRHRPARLRRRARLPAARRQGPVRRT